MTTPSSSNPSFASVPNGCPTLLIEDSMVAQLAKPSALTLVGKHVAIQLSNDLDYSRIFSKPSYYIQSCQMRLLKWTPDFDVRHESPIVPIWVSFPNLRLHFFNSQILFGLASILGRPLQMDQATASVSRPSVARVLVEVDISKKYPNEIWLGSKLNEYFQKKGDGNLPIGKVVEEQPASQAVIALPVIQPNKLPVSDVGEGIVSDVGEGNVSHNKVNNMVHNLSSHIAYDSSVNHTIVEEVNNIMDVKEDGLQALVISPLNHLDIASNIENEVVEEAGPSQLIAGIEQDFLIIEEHINGYPSGKTKIDKGKCSVEGNECFLTSLEDGVFYIENERPSKGLLLSAILEKIMTLASLRVMVYLAQGAFVAKFRFQNMWLLHDSFLDVVQVNWNAPVYPDNSISGMNRLWLKLKRLKLVLNWWNHKVFKNLFSNILIAETKINNIEDLCQYNRSEANMGILKEAKGELSKLQIQEETFWKQKAAAKHLVEGNNNTKYFHSLVNKKCSINYIHKIARANGSFTKDKDEISSMAVNFFHSHLNKAFIPYTNVDPSIIPNVITFEDNANLSKVPLMEEIKGILFNMKVDSAAGPDGYTTKFFQTTWSIIANDVFHAVKDFFNGSPIPKSNVSLWANFMKDKHCGGNHPTLSCYSKGNSKVWQRICSVKWLMEPLLAWGLGNGDIFFWQDRWVNGESIDSLLNTVSNSKMKVNYFFSANGWDVEKLYAFIPDNIIQIIIKIPFDGNVRDVLLFSGSKDGSFSIKNAWNSFRTKKGIIRNHLGFLISGFAGPAVVEDMHMVVLMSVMSGIKFCKKV
ncbi:hypothetical protein KFK09_014500 [Dendrobium nobile]|uniref:DUF4283 domain-containing protein n=1 Tax=Dendrobium nobile TaxID=94219 RepID=A0A8T3B881_DENNO|nr:hypothetical protein KFK09_014500 [Dendrobium nobile]